MTFCGIEGRTLVANVYAAATDPIVGGGQYFLKLTRRFYFCLFRLSPFRWPGSLSSSPAPSVCVLRLFVMVSLQGPFYPGHHDQLPVWL